MGCDIHCYIEYKKPTDPRWRDFGKRINPGRYYELFEKLAGVRGSDEPEVHPRGFPPDSASEASGDYWLYVSDAEDSDSSEGCCSKARADQYVSNGCVWRNEEKQWVSHPDWHNHSWLTPDEFERAIKGFPAPEYYAVLAAMRSFETQGYESRLVFWFDN